MSKLSYTQVMIAQESAAETAEKWLRQRGWEYTSNNPASTWMWQKKLPDGRVVVVSRETAEMLQSRADSIRLDFWGPQ